MKIIPTQSLREHARQGRVPRRIARHIGQVMDVEKVIEAGPRGLSYKVSAIDWAFPVEHSAVVEEKEKYKFEGVSYETFEIQLNKIINKFVEHYPEYKKSGTRAQKVFNDMMDEKKNVSQYMNRFMTLEWELSRSHQHYPQLVQQQMDRERAEQERRQNQENVNRGGPWVDAAIELYLMTHPEAAIQDLRVSRRNSGRDRRVEHLHDNELFPRMDFRRAQMQAVRDERVYHMFSKIVIDYAKDQGGYRPEYVRPGYDVGHNYLYYDVIGRNSQRVKLKNDGLRNFMAYFYNARTTSFIVDIFRKLSENSEVSPGYYNLNDNNIHYDDGSNEYTYTFKAIVKAGFELTEERGNAEEAPLDSTTPGWRAEYVVHVNEDGSLRVDGPENESIPEPENRTRGLTIDVSGLELPGPPQPSIPTPVTEETIEQVLEVSDHEESEE